MDWNNDWMPLPDDERDSPVPPCEPLQRLDSLLPSDPESGVVPYYAVHIYLGAFIELMNRHIQPLSLLYIAPDPSEMLRFLGPQGALLIGRAMSRWLRQETRTHDVVGLAETIGPEGAPSFLMVCPLMAENSAAQFADRLREAMTISANEEGSPWLSISVGVAGLALDIHDADTLVLRAEEALHSAQRAGGGRVWRHSDTLRRIIDQQRFESDHE